MPDRIIERRFLCIHLPHWPIVRRIRRQAELRHKPIVVVSMVNRRRVVADASLEAMSSVRIGMTLAEARVMCENLQVLEHEPDSDRRSLIALGRWMTRFTPIVSVGWSLLFEDEPDEPNVLLLDLTGSERLLGASDRIIEQIDSSLRRFGIPASLAIAPTPGAAWAFASQTNSVVVESDQLIQSLSNLPVESARIGVDAIQALHRLGVHTMGQLLILPRDALPSRFGLSILTRIDQLIGNQPELLTSIPFLLPITAYQEFDFSIHALESIWMVFEELTRRIVNDLTRRGHGAKRLRLICTPERFSHRPPVTKMIALSRATRDYKTLVDLIRRATERLEESTDTLEGYCSFRLDVLSHEATCDEQVTLDDDGFDQKEVNRLCDRLRVRLGDQNVFYPIPVESRLPERAWRAARYDEKLSRLEASEIVSVSTRPTRLFPTPIEIRVTSEPSDDREGRPLQFIHHGKAHRVIFAIGPERIAGEWWRGHERVRDYYEVEDESGERFWIFRVVSVVDKQQRISVRWFLHGRFE